MQLANYKIMTCWAIKELENSYHFKSSFLLLTLVFTKKSIQDQDGMLTSDGINDLSRSFRLGM